MESLKLERGIERLQDKYRDLIVDRHISGINELLSLIEKASTEGNDILIQREYCGYYVSIWGTPPFLKETKVDE